MTEDNDTQVHNSVLFPGGTDWLATWVLHALSRYVRRSFDRFGRPVCSSGWIGFHANRCSQPEDLVLNPTDRSQCHLASEVWDRRVA